MIPDYYKAEHEKAVAEAVAEDIPITVFWALDQLTNEQRRDVFNIYCVHCGSADTNCVCWKDC